MPTFRVTSSRQFDWREPGEGGQENARLQLYFPDKKADASAALVKIFSAATARPRQIICRRACYGDRPRAAMLLLIR